MSTTADQPPDHAPDDTGARARPADARGALRDGVARLGQRRVSVRDLLRGAVVVLAVLVPSVLFGVATASADANLGPHQARYDVTLDQRVTVDLGPLGTLVLDSPAPVVGVRVVVGEIPREITEIGSRTTIDALSEDLDRYVQFFSQPQATLAVVVRALVADALRGTAAAALVITGTVLLVRWLLGARRRAELAAGLRRRRRDVAVGTTLVVVLVASMGAAGTVLTGPRPPGPPSPVFAGTPLEGTVITGRLAGILDTYGSQALDVYRENDEFYATAEQNLRAEWERRTAAHERVTEVRELSGLLTRRPPDAPEPVRLLLVSDLHCNVGMAPVIRAALEESGASVLLDAGDTTMNGTAVERYCISAFDQAAGDVPVVVADGNHDSAETAQQQRDHGWTVLDGKVVEVAGIRILGAGDPRETRVGVGTVLSGEETLADRSARLYDVACSDDAGVDLLLTHDERLGQEAVRDGCAPAQVSGHYHRRVGPVQHGMGVQYVSSSTAGALLGKPTIGPLNGVAEMTVLTFDPLVRAVTEYQIVQVHPDTSVRVSHPLAWPTVRPAPLLPEPGPDDPR